MSSIFKVVLFATAMIVAVGCDSAAIKNIKTAPSGVDKTLNIGQLFDTYKYCKSGKWSDFKTERNVSVVNYTCSYDNQAVASEVLASVYDTNNKLNELFLDFLNKNSYKTTFLAQFVINADDTFDNTYLGFIEPNSDIKKIYSGTNSDVVLALVKNLPLYGIQRATRENKYLVSSLYKVYFENNLFDKELSYKDSKYLGYNSRVPKELTPELLVNLSNIESNKSDNTLKAKSKISIQSANGSKLFFEEESELSADLNEIDGNYSNLSLRDSYITMKNENNSLQIFLTIDDFGKLAVSSKTRDIFQIPEIDEAINEYINDFESKVISNKLENKVRDGKHIFNQDKSKYDSFMEDEKEGYALFSNADAINKTLDAEFLIKHKESNSATCKLQLKCTFALGSKDSYDTLHCIDTYQNSKIKVNLSSYDDHVVVKDVERNYRLNWRKNDNPNCIYTYLLKGAYFGK